MKNKLIWMGLLGSFFLVSQAQDKKKDKKKGDEKPAVTAMDTVKKAPPSKYKKYSEVITKEAKTSKGIVTSHQVGEKLYFEIPFSTYKKEFLLVSRMEETPGIAYGGTQVGEAVLVWERAYGKVLLRSIAYDNVASDSLPIYKAVKNSNLTPIVGAFDIVSFNG